uniref:Uncharacterized protein n=1 Tax=Anguilla anguilla TaxID=7936 RepID=A0A0E9UUI0_ANGAN
MPTKMRWAHRAVGILCIWSPGADTGLSTCSVNALRTI